MTDDTNDTARINFNYDAEKKEMLDALLDHGELSGILRETLDTVIEQEGFDRKTVYDARIARKEAEARELRAERDLVNREIEVAEDAKDGLREKREDVLTDEDEYRGALKALETDLRFKPANGGTIEYITTDHPRVTSIAREYDKPNPEVMDDIRERNPDIPSKAFSGVTTLNSIESFEGLPADQARLPVDERGTGWDDE